MKKLIVLLILFASSAFMATAGGGCSAQPTITEEYIDYCTSNQGRCSVVVWIGSGEYSECTSTWYDAFCNKYDAYGNLLVAKHGYCVGC